MKPSNKTRNLLHSADALAVCGALILLVGVTFSGIIMRYCLGDPFVWQEEVQLALIIWAVFLGGRYASVCGNCAATDVIIEMFPEKLQKLLSALIATAAVIILHYVGYQGVQYIMWMVRRDRMTNVLKIPYSLIYMPLPIGRLAMAVQVCLNTYRDLTGKGEEA